MKCANKRNIYSLSYNNRRYQPSASINEENACIRPSATIFRAENVEIKDAAFVGTVVFGVAAGKL